MFMPVLQRSAPAAVKIDSCCFVLKETARTEGTRYDSMSGINVDVW